MFLLNAVLVWEETFFGEIVVEVSGDESEGECLCEVSDCVLASLQVSEELGEDAKPMRRCEETRTELAK